MSEPILLPCPFCGHEGIEGKEQTLDDGLDRWIQCSNPSCKLYDVSFDNFDEWNSRPSPPDSGVRELGDQEVDDGHPMRPRRVGPEPVAGGASSETSAFRTGEGLAWENLVKALIPHLDEEARQALRDSLPRLVEEGKATVETVEAIPQGPQESSGAQGRVSDEAMQFMFERMPQHDGCDCQECEWVGELLRAIDAGRVLPASPAPVVRDVDGAIVNLPAGPKSIFEKILDRHASPANEREERRVQKFLAEENRDVG